jgi:Ca2+-transporting ATPase
MAMEPAVIARSPIDAGSPTARHLPYNEFTSDATLRQLETSPAGLSTADAAERLARLGPNALTQERSTPLWRKFSANLTNFFAILLWAAAALALVSGSLDTCLAIVAVILVNALFAFYQEFRAEQATAALQRLLPAYARVRRDGQDVRILAADLVLGDVMLLEEGDAICADARLIVESDMRTNNSTLTGESEPVRKNANVEPRTGSMTWTQLPNLVFAGTSVAAGTGEAVVFATGMNTELGHIAHLTQGVKADLSPLQIQIGQVARTVLQLSVAMGVAFFVIGHFVAHLNLRDGAIFAIGIVLANVPEGLLPTVTLALATGVQRLARQNALVKTLSSVETLGAATVICTDKTGTLTQNEMTVREAWTTRHAYTIDGVGYDPVGAFLANGRPARVDPDLACLARIAALCNNARLLAPSESRSRWEILGDPTEAALLVAAAKAGFELPAELQRNPRRHQLPFDARRKRMSVVHQPRSDGPLEVAAKGAPNEMLDCCTSILDDGCVRLLTSVDRAAIMAANDGYARNGLRVLAMAYRYLEQRPDIYTPEGVERDLTFVGLMAMQDPPRPEVRLAVEKARAAGIRMVMITGDYGLTAESIARKIGIIRCEHPRIITGVELDRLDDAALQAVLAGGDELIFARVAPEHKLRVVEAFRALGEVVAVTGDGVNDAPALKRADIGVAMGKAGTDVAREASAMILTDDNFASIVAAVEEGRAVYDNIRKFITYIFAHLAGEAVPYVLFALLNVPLPLTALQILAIDLGTETLPALALGMEKPEPDVMQRPPRPRSDRLLNLRTLLRGYFYLGLLLNVGSLFGYFWQLTQSGWHWGMTSASPLFATGTLYQRQAATMSFLGIIIMQVANVFVCRTERASVFTVGFFSNPLVFAGIAFELIFAVALIYIPVFQDVFGTAPVGLNAWLLLFAFTPLVFACEEGRKAIVRRRARVRNA